MTQRDRLLVSGLVFLVLAGAMWVMLVSPKRQEASKLDQQIVTAQFDLDAANQQNAAAAAARRNYGLDLTAVKALKEALPDDDQTAQLLYQLNAAAGDSNVKLQSISPGAVGGTSNVAPSPSAVPLPAGVVEMSLDLEFQGSFTDLQRFLARLQRATIVDGDAVKVNGRLLSVKGVTLQTDDSEQGGVSAKVVAAAYVNQPVAATGQPGAPTTPGTASTPGGAASAPATPAAPVQTAAVGAGG
jgi:Tfp pilus assembly protein PilO